jgi:uncharacterized SAM-binding protein YcdF (DUF218 family)
LYSLHIKKYFIKGLLLLFIVIVVTTPLWRPAIGQILVVSDPLAPADAVVPLAGGAHRAEYAIEIYRAGYAPAFVATDLVFISPLGRIASENNATLASAVGIPSQHIYATDHIVTSTYTELQATRDLAQRQGWRSLIIVTSPEHTRRTRIIASDVFHATGITISVQPVVGYGYDPARWWERTEEYRLTVMEYPKLAAFLVGYRGQ